MRTWKNSEQKSEKPLTSVRRVLASTVGMCLSGIGPAGGINTGISLAGDITARIGPAGDSILAYPRRGHVADTGFARGDSGQALQGT